MSDLSSSQLAEMERAAKEARDNAYTPVFDYKVGAAILTENGNIYKGCNTEAVVPSLSICAERNALSNAVSEGDYCFKAVLIVSEGEEVVYPCGSCRQYLFEFAQLVDHELEVILKSDTGETIETTISKLLPEGFGPKDLDMTLEDYRCDWKVTKSRVTRVSHSYLKLTPPLTTKVDKMRENDAHVSGSWGEVNDFLEEMVHSNVLTESDSYSATIGQVETEEGEESYTLTFHSYGGSQQLEEDLKTVAEELGYEEALNI